jgi:2-keto-4-pentenoate hydratase/2-oxohepta-3-ene-1,7-dioic acid hydratase in catechol pathway
VRLISFEGPTGSPRLGVLQGDRMLPTDGLFADAPADMAGLLAAVPGTLEALAASVASAPPSAWARLDDVRLLAPVPAPGKIVAIGRNYADHAAEEGAVAPTAPLIFAKFPSSVVGPGADVRWDPSFTSQVDYEAELAVVIGHRASHVAEEDAMDYVLGYTCLNDVTARDIQFGDGQWVRGKSLDTFCPMGPSLVTADELADPGDLRITCAVNGVTVQEDRTSSMFHGVAKLISHCSRAFTLLPGDVIATGTPAGVGIFRTPPLLLGDGDVMVVSIEDIGDLVNTCRFERPSEVTPA